MAHIHQGYEHHARERVRVSDDSLPRPGFKSAAVYFEWLAQKETRDYDQRQWLLEVARFTMTEPSGRCSKLASERWHSGSAEVVPLALAERSS